MGFQLEQFLNGVKEKKTQAEGSLYRSVYSINSEVQ